MMLRLEKGAKIEAVTCIYSAFTTSSCMMPASIMVEPAILPWHKDVVQRGFSRRHISRFHTQALPFFNWVARCMIASSRFEHHALLNVLGRSNDVIMSLKASGMAYMAVCDQGILFLLGLILHISSAHGIHYQNGQVAYLSTNQTLELAN